MLRRIKLYGRLAKFIGKRVLKADVASAAEAVRFLIANFPELEKHMADQNYRISAGDFDIGEDELHYPVGQSDIKIVPVVSGAGAVGRIIAGVALVALSFVTFGAGAFAGVGIAGAWGSTLALGIGASLVLGGVAELITPVPRPVEPMMGSGKDTDNDPRKSYSFSGIQNVSRQGVPIPVIYGETIVGSVVISAAVDVVQT